MIIRKPVHLRAAAAEVVKGNMTVKTYKSLKGIPIKVEMQPVEHQSDSVLSPNDLASQIEEARKGKAKVDSKYVGLGDGLNHLFDYKYNYGEFLSNMSYIIKKGKE